MPFTELDRNILWATLFQCNPTELSAISEGISDIRKSRLFEYLKIGSKIRWEQGRKGTYYGQVTSINKMSVMCEVISCPNYRDTGRTWRLSWDLFDLIDEDRKVEPTSIPVPMSIPAELKRKMRV